MIFEIKAPVFSENFMSTESSCNDISNETAETVKFKFYHYKYMETISCHSNRSSYQTGTKTQLFLSLPIDALCEI